MVEAQAVDRVHRMGQRVQVLITRYLTTRSIEEVSKCGYISTLHSRCIHFQYHITDREQYMRRVQEEKKNLVTRSLENTHISQAEIDEKR